MRPAVSMDGMTSELSGVIIGPTDIFPPTRLYIMDWCSGSLHFRYAITEKCQAHKLYYLDDHYRKHTVLTYVCLLY